MVISSLAKILKLMYFGTIHVKMHLTSYIASLISSSLWFIFMFVPVIALSGNIVKAYVTFLPGLLALLSCGVAISSAVEFLRWFVNQGLTDMFRENGLNTFSYLLSSIHVDVPIFGLLSYMLVGYVTSYYLGLDPQIIIPLRPHYLIAALAVLAPTYLLIGSLVAYLYTITRISSAWMLLLQLALTLGTIVPPSPPNQLMYLLNPATIVSELARAAYYSSIIDEGLLIMLIVLIIPLYSILAYLLSRESDKYISRYGLEYRY